MNPCLHILFYANRAGHHTAHRWKFVNFFDIIFIHFEHFVDFYINFEWISFLSIPSYSFTLLSQVTSFPH